MARGNPFLIGLWVSGVLLGAVGLIMLVSTSSTDDADGLFDTPVEPALGVSQYVGGLLLQIGILGILGAAVASAVLWRPTPQTASTPLPSPKPERPLREDDPQYRPAFPGWYPAEGGERYYDGGGWTDQTR